MGRRERGPGAAFRERVRLDGPVTVYQADPAAAPVAPCTGHLPVRTEIGRPSGPRAADPTIESRAVRRDLERGDGKICLVIAPGDRLGELHVGAQYEGPIDTGHGEPDDCTTGHNALLDHTGAWLGAALERLLAPAVAVKVAVHTTPCPKARVAVDVATACEHLLPVGSGAGAGAAVSVGAGVDTGVGVGRQR